MNNEIYSRFKERTTDKNKDYNSCYIFHLNDECLLKDECAECDLCVTEDVYDEFICKADKLCEYG